MKNLIDEIEKIIEDLKIEKQKCLEEIDYPLSQVDRLEGRILAYTDIFMALNQYNIITTPKSIKLSEILEKLNISKWQDFQATKQVNAISIDNNNCLREYLNIENNKITDISDDMQVNEYKWLYTLWIAKVEIIDDLECDE